jgi:hypothetical protein
LTDQTAQALPRRPLEGIKVIDIANFLAAPIGAMFLGDFGAEHNARSHGREHPIEFDTRGRRSVFAWRVFRRGS